LHIPPMLVSIGAHFSAGKILSVSMMIWGGCDAG